MNDGRKLKPVHKKLDFFVSTQPKSSDVNYDDYSKEA
jgi:hypothetical protein